MGRERIEMDAISIDDCLKTIPNRFDLTLAATWRARQLANGAESYLSGAPGKSKPNVVALREISQGSVGMEVLRRR